MAASPSVCPSSLLCHRLARTPENLPETAGWRTRSSCGSRCEASAPRASPRCYLLSRHHCQGRHLNASLCRTHHTVVALPKTGDVSDRVHIGEREPPSYIFRAPRWI
ncbi:hypothetical protein GDO81_023466 [Engystomops pustulosus]|uniref:Uncharacterized protein n=1 Tax=Engystomops pustulosus TaxID=76066 RepID=A0AAV6YW37_ENGPU|nr:hypothetical protein GDO81_023466 [Engystomops pustulosus]